MDGSNKMIFTATDICLNLNGCNRFCNYWIFFKIRPSLTPSKEGLKTFNIH